MKCKYCGGEIQLEELYCPYCGRPNEEAQQHARDMRRFQAEFQQTKTDVTAKAGNASRIAVRIAAIAFLIVGITINIILQANSWSIRHSIERRNANKNASVHREILEEYLENEDYIGFAAYCSAQNLPMSDEVYDDCYAVYRIAGSYRYAAEQIMKLVNRERYASADTTVKYTIEYVQEFYETLDPESYRWDDSYDEKETQAHIAKMKHSMEALLITYLGMTPEEASGMESLSRAGRAMLIERGAAKYLADADDPESNPAAANDDAAQTEEAQGDA